MEKLRLLAKTTHYQAVHIAPNDMIHITWKHASIRLNVTGLIYLADFLNGVCRHPRCRTDFQIMGTPDDGYQVWIQAVGLRLSADDFQHFKTLINDSLSHLKAGGYLDHHDLPTYLALTFPASECDHFHHN